MAGIFRPLHEAGGKWFWWSINSGDQFAALYRLVYDRMVKVKGVKNMIWVYNPEGSAVTAWDPGSEYYDVISIDIYNDDNDHSSNASAFDKFKNASNATKILALSENGPIPDVNNMHTDEAVWSWWMPWYGTWSGNLARPNEGCRVEEQYGRRTRHFARGHARLGPIQAQAGHFDDASCKGVAVLRGCRNHRNL